MPADVVSRAATLTRRVRQPVDDDERAAVSAERDRLLADHGYVARVREDDAGETLVLYPDEWVGDGVVRVDRVEDTGRAVERSLSGVGSDDWGDVAAHNRRIADRVADVHGDPHGETAHAYADFMSNHYGKRVERATPAERREFREEYFPRNAWPTEAQREAVEESLRRIEETAETE
ncbi:rnhA operon protein [Halobacteriales archaeon QH_7_69_31]|nr:MAG: rnhA operon protein [Halobacteriales archaeon QH_7_69_31]